ncbi:hypothetical protein [Nitrososphaera sp. AFS]|uniref:hypothetical protein n=1 Tax=Nitrososphaera sp. AFS TaxID=2301191 RepID=UPI0013923AAF|nr:hypothetical protein [Nitrososphaera sp. AFS]NAL78406.1 hypothetical protein [Nitrososphaera sp. AFS]
MTNYYIFRNPAVLVLVLVVTVMMPIQLARAAMDDASFQDCWNQLLQRTGMSDNLMPQGFKNKIEHQILAGNLSAGSSNSINIYNNTLNNVPSPMKEQLSTCMNTGQLPP